MNRAFYSDAIQDFLGKSADEILGSLTRGSDFDLGQSQRDAWLEEIRILQAALIPFQGSIYFEYSIPRMGRRADVVLLIGPAVLVLEFKVGERDFPQHALDQVIDYALDLKNFHEASHSRFVAPILISTDAGDCPPVLEKAPHQEGFFWPIKTNAKQLGGAIRVVLQGTEGAT